MILQGDSLEKLKTLESESVDVCITSPPYYGLRRYEAGPEQYGLEPTVHEYLNKLYLVMDELKRVVKDTGTVWINLGDSYNGTKTGNSNGLSGTVVQKAGINEMIFTKHKDDRIRLKSRFGVPERFYIRCIDDGWIARGHLVWHKRNAMPASVTDRFTNSWNQYSSSPRMRNTTLTWTRYWKSQSRNHQRTQRGKDASRTTLN